MSISGSGVSRFAQLAASVPTGPRRWLSTAESAGAVNATVDPDGTPALSASLRVTDEAVMAVTAIPSGTPAALADMPAATPLVEAKVSTAAPEGASVVVVSESGAATIASQLDSSQTVSISCR